MNRYPFQKTPPNHPLTGGGELYPGYCPAGGRGARDRPALSRAESDHADA